MEEMFDFGPVIEPIIHVIGPAMSVWLLAMSTLFIYFIIRKAMRPDRDYVYYPTTAKDPEPFPAPADPSTQVKILDELIGKLTSREAKEAKKELQDIKSWVQDLAVKDPKDELNARASVQSDLQTIFGITEKYIGIQKDRGPVFDESRRKALANIQVRGENIQAWVSKANQRNIAMIDSYNEINQGTQIKALRELEK